MSNRIVTRCASMLLAAFVFAGCSDDEPTGVDILPFDVAPISFALDLGGTKQIKLTGVSNADVTWESLNPAVATVDANGIVTGVAVGTTAITAVGKSDGFKASATVQVNAVFGTQIAANTNITISGATGTQTLYRVFVPEGKTSLVVTISGSSGDADLYTRFGTPPTFSTRDCRPFLVGSNETCTHPNPAEGSWYIWIDAYEGYTGLTLRASITP